MDEPARYLADHYQQLGDQRNDFRNINLYRLVIDQVRGQKVLDIGCGSGALLDLLDGAGHEVFGIEPNAALIEMAGRRNRDLTLFEGTGDLLAQLPHRFDTITILDVLEHIEDDCEQIRLMHEALADDGQLVIIVPAFPVLYGKRDENNGHFRRYQRRELKEKLTGNGFVIRKCRYWNALGFPPYWVSERLLRRELNTSLRGESRKNALQRFLVGMLQAWFRGVENRISFGFGLSLLVVADKARPAAAMRDQAA